MALRIGRPHMLHEVRRNCCIDEKLTSVNKGKWYWDCGFLPKMCGLVLVSQVFLQLRQKCSSSCNMNTYSLYLKKMCCSLSLGLPL